MVPRPEASTRVRHLAVMALSCPVVSRFGPAIRSLAGGPIPVTEPIPSRPERLEDRIERSEIPNLPNLLNRELSWLEFNARVLREAEDPDNPLLERLKFIAIFDSNLDEFFMKRVGGLKQQLASNVRELGPDSGGTPRQQLAAINAAVRPLVARQRRLLKEELLPALRQHGLEIVPWGELKASERRYL